MADPTYEVKVYLDNEGDRQVVTSDGVIDIETGGNINLSAGGNLNLGSGANMSMLSSFNFGLAGEDLAADDARRVLVSEQTGVEIQVSGGNSVFQTLNLPKNANYVTLYASASAISASFWLTSCSEGRDVWLYLRGDSTGTFTNASTQVDVSLSGCILLGSVGAAISGFEMHTSLASDCGVHLHAVRDNVWAIVSQFGDIDE
jgi:hypothetical protein